MSTIEIGSKPEKIKVNLLEGGSFTATLNFETNLPAGVSVVLVFKKEDTKVQWSAALNTNSAVWDMDVDEVAEIIDFGLTDVRLHYIEADGSVIVWGSGEVNVL